MYNSGAGAAIATPFQIIADGARDDMETPTNRTTATSLYRYYDVAGVLIYVGITRTGIIRNRQHNDDKEWWQWVASQQVDHFPSADAAHAKEVELIQRYRPPFNKQHNPDYAAMSAAYRAARDGDEHWSGLMDKACEGKGVVRALVRDADWPRGDVYLQTSIGASITVARLIHQPGRPLTTDGGRVIGHVMSIEHIGPTATLHVRAKHRWRFCIADIDIRITGSGAVVKKIVAVDATLAEMPKRKVN